jgi:hypothetical protein
MKTYIKTLSATPSKRPSSMRLRISSWLNLSSLSRLSFPPVISLLSLGVFTGELVRDLCLIRS